MQLHVSKEELRRWRHVAVVAHYAVLDRSIYTRIRGFCVYGVLTFLHRVVVRCEHVSRYLVHSFSAGET
jgi:hypothetical protein